MASTAPAAPSSSNRGSRTQAEHRFFAAYMIVVAALILYGFAPSFFLRGIVPPSRPLAPLRRDMIAHGLLGTVFLAFLPLQAWLISSGRRTLHMKLGKWGFAAGAIMLCSLYVVTAFSHHAFPTNVPGLTAAMASAPSLYAVFVFAALLWIAWRHRFEAQAHKRLIVALSCQITGPGIARTPFVPPPPNSFLIVDSILGVEMLPLFVWDVVTLRRIHWATWAGFAAIAAMILATLLTGMFPALTGFVSLLPGYGWP